jgi:hypothetical protein
VKSKYKPTKRHKKSKFDPYIEEITKYVVTGATVKEIAELIEYLFDDIVDINALYCFMRSRGLQSRVSMGGTNKDFTAPYCRGCDDCIEITNTHHVKSLLCLAAKTMIPKTCTTSPIWCHKRERQAG